MHTITKSHVKGARTATLRARCSCGEFTSDTPRLSTPGRRKQDRLIREHISSATAQFRLEDANTRFDLPIIHPVTGEEVSAEALYNSCCDAMGHVVRDHIGDLILDNFKYGPKHDENALCNAVYAWADDVHRQLAAADPAPAATLLADASIEPVL